MRLSPRKIFALISLVSIMSLAGGLALGEFARLQPCYLCNFQRLLYILLALFALCGALIPVGQKFWAVLVGLTALGGVATAVQQSWMQYAPQQVVECGIGDPTLVERIVDWLGMQWPAMFMVMGNCTVKDWVFLGLSLANWSVLCFSLLFAASLWLVLQRKPG